MPTPLTGSRCKLRLNTEGTVLGFDQHFTRGWYITLMFPSLADICYHACAGLFQRMFLGQG
jgi:hypothetical protein